MEPTFLFPFIAKYCIIADPASVLFALLTRISERTNYCPYCYGEYVCDSDCVLKDIWFRGISGHSSPLSND